MKDSTTRFSDRVDDYIKYRPSYPKEMIAILQKELDLFPSNPVADIGCGTGISSAPFLDNGNTVYGIEPNREMRIASKETLKKYPNFIAIEGSAEATTLQDKSVDLIFCGQAFHWFDKENAKKEFDRILKPGGHIVLAWNSRCTKSGFQKEYENALFENIAEYKFVNHRNITSKEILGFFEPRIMKSFQISNKQSFNLEGLKGRLRSCSYCPKSGISYDKLMKQLEDIYHKYEKNGIIEFEYETDLYLS